MSTDKKNPSHEQLNLLKNEDFFNTLIREINKKVVGEQDTIRTVLLVALGGILCENGTSTSMNLLINDTHGSGYALPYW